MLRYLTEFLMSSHITNLCFVYLERLLGKLAKDIYCQLIGVFFFHWNISIHTFDENFVSCVFVHSFSGASIKKKNHKIKRILTNLQRFFRNSRLLKTQHTINLLNTKVSLSHEHSIAKFHQMNRSTSFG